MKDLKIITRHLNTANSADIDVYLADGGYQALKKALSMTPEEVIAEVKRSKLVGRGGAAFPTGLKWELTRKEKANPKYIVCNASEGEPGTFKDRLILKNDPHMVLVGFIIAAYAVGTSQGFIHAREVYTQEIELFQKAIDQATERGFLGQNIMGSNFSLDIQFYKSAGAYICGEETALFESLEGHRGIPATRPPYPVQVGLMDKPTTVNNVETLCNIPAIINNGADWFASIGHPDYPGTKLFCLSGNVKKPGVFELPLGTNLKDLLEAGGGVDGKFKAVLPGGISSSLLTETDISLDFKTLAKAGTMLGSGAVIVINSDTSMVNVASNVAHFFDEEGCGKCSICREGTLRAAEILSRFSRGQGNRNELEWLLELHEVMKDTASCGLGQVALNVAASAIRNFKGEFLAQVRKEEGVWLR